MATSTVQTKALSSENFVESCGAVLFDLSNLSDIKVCLIQHRDRGEWHFAKGRRNQNEARKDAAIREVMEETGFRCRLLPVTMPTRATAEDAHADVQDKPQVCKNLTEPFMCHIRNLKHGKGTKIIWWFIAALEDDEDNAKLPGEDKWLPALLPWRGALNTLTFQNDRELLQKALQLLQNT
ncbi:NUDIX domain-containing protein, partial [Bimuria novae-zelandiae CBS 107.79]